MTNFNEKFYIALFVICMGSAFQYGYYMGVLNVLDKVIKDWIADIYDSKTPDEINVLWSTTVAIFPGGGALGALFIPLIIKRFGRQKTVFYIDYLVIMPGFTLSVLSKTFNSLVVLIIGRFIIGYGTSLCLGASIIYLIEISPTSIRIIVATVYHFIIKVSILIAQIFGLSEIVGNQYNWPMIFIPPFMAIFFSTCLEKYCPESPQYLLVTKKAEKEAKTNLICLRKSEEIDSELIEMNNINDNNLFIDSALIMKFIIAISEQLCGSTILVYYSNEIFRGTGLKGNLPSYITVAEMLILVCGALFSSFTVKNFAWKKPLLFSMTTAFITTILLLTIHQENKEYCKYVCLVFIVVLVFAFGIIGSISWIIIVEISNYNTRPLVVSATLFVNFFMDFVICQTFLLTKPPGRYYGFIPFLIFDFIIFWIVYFVWKKQY